MNAIFFAIVAIAFAVAAWRQVTFDAPVGTDVETPMDILGKNMIGTAGDAAHRSNDVDGIGSDGGFAGQHDRRGAVEDSVGDI